MNRPSLAFGRPSTRKKGVDETGGTSPWARKLTALQTALDNLAASGENGRLLSPDEAFSLLIDSSRALRQAGGGLFLLGNGASASLASHTAIDLMKNGGLRTTVFTDPALMTAMANDYGYEKVFVAPLKCCLRPGDLVAAVSSSGESENILQAAEVATEAGATVITLSAMSPDNRLRGLGDINFYVPAPTYGLAESAHAVILHHWVDLMSAKATEA